MSYIIVDDEQAKIIAESSDQVEIRDRRGNPLGYIVRCFTDEDIHVAKQRLTSTEPRFTTQQVIEHLRSLEHK